MDGTQLPTMEDIHKTKQRSKGIFKDTSHIHTYQGLFIVLQFNNYCPVCLQSALLTHYAFYHYPEPSLIITIKTTWRIIWLLNQIGIWSDLAMLRETHKKKTLELFLEPHRPYRAF